MNYREELFKALTAGVDGAFRDKSIDALVDVCKAARKEGHKQGIEEGNINDGTLAEKLKEAYTNGANDAWELARNLYYSDMYDEDREMIFGHSDVDDIVKRLEGVEALAKLKEYEEAQKEPAIKVGDRVEIMEGHDITGLYAERVGTIGEVMDVDCDGDYLVQAYEEHSVPYYYSADALKLANDEILVGDEVIDVIGKEGVVMRVDGEYLTLVESDGTALRFPIEKYKRTGRHFPQIGEVLQQIQEGDT